MKVAAIFSGILAFILGVASGVKHNPNCAAPLIYAPVCGSDGETYSNHWVLECDQKIRPQLQKLHDGACN